MLAGAAPPRRAHRPPPGAGGPLTVTDANLCLGRLLPEYFPRIFGPGEDQPLCREAAARAFRELAARIDAFLADADAGTGARQPLSVEEVAMGFVRVANEAMCRPIRALTQVGWPRGGVGGGALPVSPGVTQPCVSPPPRQARGHDAARHVLACFGGAGGQHACAIARALGMSRVFIHK